MMNNIIELKNKKNTNHFVFGIQKYLIETAEKLVSTSEFLIH